MAKPARKPHLPSFLLNAVLLLCVAGCGDAYSTHVPAQKQIVHMFLSKEAMLVDQQEEVIAYVFTPSETHYVIAQPDFGDGIIVEFDSGAGKGCAQADTGDIIAPNIWEPTFVFPICLTLIPQHGAALGARTVSIEVDSDGALIVAQHPSFFVVAP